MRIRSTFLARAARLPWGPIPISHRRPGWDASAAAALTLTRRSSCIYVADSLFHVCNESCLMLEILRCSEDQTGALVGEDDQVPPSATVLTNFV